MKALVALIPLVFFAGGFFLGRMKTASNKHYEKMYQVASRRSEKADRLISNLSDQAIYHDALGDSFAVIVQDEIRKYRVSDGQLS